MELHAGQYGDIVLISVAFSALILTVGVMLVFRDTVGSTLEGFAAIFTGGGRRAARAAVDELKMSLAYLRERVELLDEYSSEYHNAFHAAGWDQVVESFNELSAADAILEMMLERKRHRDAFTLASMLLGELPPELHLQAAEQFDDFAHLAGWQDRVRETLLRVIDEAHEAAQTNQDLGVKRARARQPTLVTLAEIKRSLE